MPNITVRAAAEGMPAINRRRLLNLTGAGLALAATSAAVRNVSAATIPAASAEHPDAELLALDKEMEAAHARMVRASKVCRKVGRKCEKLYPPRPPKWEDPDMPDHLHEMNLDRRIRDCQEIPEPIRAWFKERGEQRAANKALQDAYHAKWEEINREGGVDAAEEAFNAFATRSGKPASHLRDPCLHPRRYGGENPRRPEIRTGEFF
ncbi:hypothetical protein [Mesorhizobium escarrei]|uniref:Twin-arginine translocation signal domain-containing protein n=1 Tax=Mesorhizobium escarrei TaxID=666018 RepID=A0ABM9E3M9_9HYPH|nr:hypothetical protein [Mesorhizobium escarrei]CAH2403326.1 hypothetical protein MES5069_370015 [Mesorhizobium escarrei]